MADKEMRLLLGLVANYVSKTELTVPEIRGFLNKLEAYSKAELTSEEKSQMVNYTIGALNAGSDEAMEGAFDVRLAALVSGDAGLIEEIEYLWEVI